MCKLLSAAVSVHASDKRQDCWQPFRLLLYARLSKLSNIINGILQTQSCLQAICIIYKEK